MYRASSEGNCFCSCIVSSEVSRSKMIVFFLSNSRSDQKRQVSDTLAQVSTSEKNTSPYLQPSVAVYWTHCCFVYQQSMQSKYHKAAVVVKLVAQDQFLSSNLKRDNDILGNIIPLFDFAFTLNVIMDRTFHIIAATPTATALNNTKLIVKNDSACVQCS